MNSDFAVVRLCPHGGIEYFGKAGLRPQRRNFIALVNLLGDELGEVEPRFGDARVDDKSDVAKRVKP